MRGRVLVEEGPVRPPALVSRPSLKDTMLAALRYLLKTGQELLVSSEAGSEISGDSAISLLQPSTSYSLLPGDSFGLLELASGQSCQFDRITVTAGPCWILTVSSSNQNGIAWASKANALLQQRRRKHNRMLEDNT